ncbi:MAG: hypothetical protein V4736_05210 [Bdellovibrionota bacterium]
MKNILWLPLIVLVGCASNSEVKKDAVISSSVVTESKVESAPAVPESRGPAAITTTTKKTKRSVATTPDKSEVNCFDQLFLFSGAFQKVEGQTAKHPELIHIYISFTEDGGTVFNIDSLNVSAKPLKEVEYGDGSVKVGTMNVEADRNILSVHAGIKVNCIKDTFRISFTDYFKDDKSDDDNVNWLVIGDSKTLRLQHGDQVANYTRLTQGKVQGLSRSW